MEIGKSISEALNYIEKVEALARGEIVTVEGVPILAREVSSSVCACEECPMLERCSRGILDMCADVDAITRKKHQLLIWKNEEEEEET